MSKALLRSINPTKDTWNVKVRVVRMWDSRNLKTNELISVDMILLDEEESAIHASITKNQIARFKHLISEGEVYEIRNFRVVELDAANKYRPVCNRLKIFFMMTTSVTQKNGGKATIPLHYFEYADYSKIGDRCNDNTHLTDVIGLLRQIDTIKEISVASRKTHVRRIEIELKQNNIVSVNLWGPSAIEIDDDMIENCTGPQIVSVTSTTVKTYLGEYTLSTTNASKIHLNLETEEVSKLLARYAHYEPCLTLTQSDRSSIPDEELAQQNRKTISDILLMGSDPPQQEFKFTCIAKIQEVNPTYGWFYIACNKCNRIVTQTEQSTWCAYCKCVPEFSIPRYRVHVTVGDSTGSTSLVMFGSQVEKLIDKTVNELCTDAVEKNAIKKVPEAVERLCGNMYIFQVHVTTYNIEKRWDNFTVKKVLDPVITGEDQRKVTFQHEFETQEDEDSLTNEDKQFQHSVITGEKKDTTFEPEVIKKEKADPQWTTIKDASCVSLTLPKNRGKRSSRSKGKKATNTVNNISDSDHEMDPLEIVPQVHSRSMKLKRTLLSTHDPESNDAHGKYNRKTNIAPKVKQTEGFTKATKRKQKVIDPTRESPPPDAHEDEEATFSDNLSDSRTNNSQRNTPFLPRETAEPKDDHDFVFRESLYSVVPKRTKLKQPWGSKATTTRNRKLLSKKNAIANDDSDIFDSDGDVAQLVKHSDIRTKCMDINKTLHQSKVINVATDDDEICDIDQDEALSKSLPKALIKNTQRRQALNRKEIPTENSTNELYESEDDNPLSEGATDDDTKANNNQRTLNSRGRATGNSPNHIAPDSDQDHAATLLGKKTTTVTTGKDIDETTETDRAMYDDPQEGHIKHRKLKKPTSRRWKTQNVKRSDISNKVIKNGEQDKLPGVADHIAADQTSHRATKRKRVLSLKAQEALNSANVASSKRRSTK